jgi:hypothetical protein
MHQACNIRNVCTSLHLLIELLHTKRFNNKLIVKHLGKEQT